MQEICAMDVGSAGHPPCAGRPPPRRGDEILARQVGLHSVKVPDRGRRGGPVQDGLDAVVRRLGLCCPVGARRSMRDVMRVA